MTSIAVNGGSTAEDSPTVSDSGEQPEAEYLEVDAYSDDSYYTSSSAASSSSHRESSLTGTEILERIRNVFFLLTRDWSNEGKKERDTCYLPVINEIKKRYAQQCPETTKILLPGAGMGRLAYEIACLGYETILNEESTFLVIALKRLFGWIIRL
eukprot:gene4445-5211_t